MTCTVLVKLLPRWLRSACLSLIHRFIACQLQATFWARYWRWFRVHLSPGLLGCIPTHVVVSHEYCDNCDHISSFGLSVLNIILWGQCYNWVLFTVCDPPLFHPSSPCCLYPNNKPCQSSNFLSGVLLVSSWSMPTSFQIRRDGLVHF